MSSLLITITAMVANVCMLLAAGWLARALFASRAPVAPRRMKGRVGAAKRRIAVKVPPAPPQGPEPTSSPNGETRATTLPTGSGGGSDLGNQTAL